MASEAAESNKPGGWQAIVPVSPQNVTVSSSSAQSAALGAGTTLVRLAATTDMWLAFGTNPTATTSGIFMPSGSIEYFGVSPGSKIAAIRDSADGKLNIVEAGATSP